jgi:drug/metabolite transporter (DMT)-like permease
MSMRQSLQAKARGLCVSAEAIEARWLAISPHMRGALWTLLGGLLFSIMSVLIKVLGTRLDIFQVAFFRAAFGLATLLPFAIAAGPRVLRTHRPMAHVIRGLIGAAGMFCGFYSIAKLPLADSSAYSFTRPLFLIVLAVLFLGERIRLRRVTATAVGFVGVLVMLRPHGGIETAAVVGLLGALFAALVSIFIKQLSETEKPITVLLYFGLVSTAVTLAPAVFVWQPATLWELIMLMLIGATGASAQSAMIRGYAITEATAVAGYDYARLIYAAVLGFAVFGEVPGLWTVAGALTVASSTLYIAYREAQLGKRAPPPMPDAAAVAATPVVRTQG